MALAILSVCDVSFAAETEKGNTELWAGHQVVYGSTVVPFLGKKETRTDTYMLAKVKRSESHLDIEQIACLMKFRKIAGVKVQIPFEALVRLPPVKFRFDIVSDELKARPWVVSWDKNDIDDDNHPGMTVVVEAPICSGQLYVANRSVSTALGQKTADGIAGKIHVEVTQRVLDSNSACLKFFSSDSEEKQDGYFAYRRVSPDATCKSLLAEKWPIILKSSKTDE